MNAEIITIGEELLIGQIINTNASWMAERLNEAGMVVRQVSVVTDNEAEIHRILAEALQRSDLVLMTGGLGPTRDDVTKLALCRFFQTELILSEEVLEDVRALFARRNYPLTNLNRQQAMVPASARILRNPNGTAPGLWFEQSGKICVAMPGVPYEMKAMVEDKILPELKKRREGQYILHRTVLTQGVGESFLSEIITRWEDNLPSFIRLAYLPSPGMVRLRMSATGPNETALKEALDKEEKKLADLIPQYIWGYDRDTLEAIIGRLLTEKGLTLATAESCTGGFLAHKITSVAGSSAYFRGSIIAYANEIKRRFLWVDDELLARYGAVSREVVETMALNGCQVMSSDFCVATSGIAGPTGGTPEKPVGTVWIAVAFHGQVTSKLLHLGDQRDRNITRATLGALALLREKILQV
ncbi:MAG: competence/damage-inducible protein A [Bacteroides sp.]|jgi:nicotinamide-nucleotide amidase|nr:competence/damage-inducible protein A [Bacteroides sp.]